MGFRHCNCIVVFDKNKEKITKAIIAFLESENYEDAVRNAVSLGGDTDTLAAITGSIAEAFLIDYSWAEIDFV